MLAVVTDLESGFAGFVEAVDQRGQWTISFAEELNRPAISKQARPAANDAVATLSFETLKFPGRLALDVFTPQHLFELRATNFASQSIHLVIGNGAKFALHLF